MRVGHVKERQRSVSVNELVDFNSNTADKGKITQDAEKEAYGNVQTSSDWNERIRKPEKLCRHVPPPPPPTGFLAGKRDVATLSHERFLQMINHRIA